MQKNETFNVPVPLLQKYFDPSISRRVFLLFWVYAIFLVGMNLMPGSTEKLEMKKIVFVRMDYFYHCMAYMILAGLYTIASFSPRPVFRKYALVLGMVVLFLIATIPEWLQNFVPNRRFNWYDMLANFTGLAIGTLFTTLFWKFFSSKRKKYLLK